MARCGSGALCALLQRVASIFATMRLEWPCAAASSSCTMDSSILFCKDLVQVPLRMLWVQDLRQQCPDNWIPRDGLCVADPAADLPDAFCDVQSVLFCGFCRFLRNCGSLPSIRLIGLHSRSKNSQNVAMCFETESRIGLKRPFRKAALIQVLWGGCSQNDADESAQTETRQAFFSSSFRACKLNGSQPGRGIFNKAGPVDNDGSILGQSGSTRFVSDKKNGFASPRVLTSGPVDEHGDLRV